MSFDFLSKPIAPGLYEPEGIYLSPPFEGRPTITQLWGENPDIYRQFKPGGVALEGHNGIDFAVAGGSRVLAAADGRIVEIGNDAQGYGRYIKLQHRWGESLYAHLQGFTVESGQRVSRHQLIAYSNNTGLSTGPHLHFGIRIVPYTRSDGWGGFSDPLPFLDPEAVILPPYARDRATRRRR